MATPQEEGAHMTVWILTERHDGMLGQDLIVGVYSVEARARQVCSQLVTAGQAAHLRSCVLDTSEPSKAEASA
jgi:hypothetical protein